MIALYPDIHYLDEGSLARFFDKTSAYALDLFDMARDLLGWYRVYPDGCEDYAAFAHDYLHALQLDVVQAIGARDTLQLSQLVEDVEEVLRELQRRVNEPAQAA